MRRGLRYGLGGLFGLLLLILLVCAVLLGSQAGSRWLLGQVPGLNVSAFEGRLAGRWQAERLSWEQDGTRLELQQPVLVWSPSCLLRGTLCIDELSSTRIELQLAQTDTPSDEPFSLPTLQLPLAIRLGDVHVGAFVLDGNEQLQELQLLATWQADGIHIERLGAQLDGLALTLQGSVLPEGDWPLQATASAQLPAPDGQPWQLDVSASGELLQRVQLKGESQGYLAATLTGELQPLAEHLPASLRIHAKTFRADSELPEPLTLQQVELQASGDLQQGYAVHGVAQLPGEGGAVALNLAGRVNAAGAEIKRLQLSAGPEQLVTLTGQLDWQDAFSASSQLDWQDFPWQRLLPQEQAPPVALRHLQADLSYASEHYAGNLQAQLDGPAGAFSLASRLTGDLSQLRLDDLKLQAGQGSAQGHVQLAFADGIGWDAALQVADLDPAYWLAELPGNLGGALVSQGSLKSERLELNANLDLQGRLRGQRAQLQANAAGAGERWSLERLDLQVGNNRISGQGRLDRELSGQLDLALEQLGQLWPRLAGRATGRLDLAGSLQAPQGTLQLSGNGLAFADNRAQALTLNARLDAAQRGSVQIEAQRLASGDTRIGNLQLNGSGTRQRQQLDLALDGGPAELKLALAGDWNGSAWRGRLASGKVQGGGQTWQLEKPARLDYLADGRLEFGAHCWRSGEASLCGGEQRLLPEPRIDYKLRDFPLASLAPWLPEDFAWQGVLNADIDLRLPAGGPSGRVLIDAGNGVLRIREEQRWVELPYQRLQLDSTLRPQRIDSRLEFAGQGLGQLQLDAQLDPRPQLKPLSGQFRIDGVDLSVARPFVAAVETLEGQLQGAGTLGGTLQAPRVSGTLKLSDGKLAGGDLPTVIEQLQVQARIEGERMALAGDWRSGEQGQGSLSGDLAWGDATEVDLRLRGSRLPVVVEPYANLEADPDLRIALAAGRLAVSGKVAVPRGTIRIRELPPQTVKVSPDARVVGEQTPEASPLQLGMDVQVDVGADRLRFIGFGLTADLKGRLQVGDNLATRGELVLSNGRYRAYGQRLDLRRARLLFAGPLDQPYLDVEAIRKVGDVTAGVRLNGRADAPRSEVFSTPAMSQEQALSYLVLGRPMNSGGDGNALGQAALAMGLSGSAPVTGALAERLGIKDFQLDDDGASGRLSERLSIRYGLGVLEPSSVVALRYELSKRLYLEAASGLASSLDLFYRRDF
ncbi:translocation/assembly module TamB [Pseudomonas sp. PDM14]|uniref:translocation/assembly module TamB domain-containing protein n=1 Tax=Pseudomonas sp. PDM14 TaxID=2769288 RepID=UPI00177BBF03|nr:translocation/assembly module TamB domain-containing protein [Pseudomonas sp. PDM14]MBD9484061.1 translocation/assembly module TamB [Pseudomonas sp. PDM14]